MDGCEGIAPISTPKATSTEGATSTARHERARRVVTLAALVALACGCETVVAGGKVEESIHADLKAKGVDLAAIHCPTKIVVQKGAKLFCSANDEDGNTATFAVTFTDAKGGIDWSVDAQLLDLKKFGDALESVLSDQVGKPVDVSCPARGVITKVGRKIACDADVGGRASRVQCTMNDDDGHATCDLQPVG